MSTTEGSENANTTVVVTGANGYLASWIVQKLLEKGYTVRGTVRDASNEKKTEHLLEMEGASERLKLYSATFDEDGSFDAVMEGADVLLHTASPFHMTVEDGQRDLIDPAVAGTKSALYSAKKAGTIKRVVLTSSNAAVQDEIDESIVYDGTQWNELSTAKRNPYYASKTQAEKAAWAVAEEDDTEFDLVSINPYLILGPGANPSPSASGELVRQLLEGEFPAVVAMQMGIVDVRDVAEAHIRAFERKEANGRYYMVAGSPWLADMAKVMLEMEEAKDYPIPTTDFTGWFGRQLTWLGSFGDPNGELIRCNLNKTLSFDCSKVKNELFDGKELIPWEESLQEMVRFLLESGTVPPLETDAKGKKKLVKKK